MSKYIKTLFLLVLLSACEPYGSQKAVDSPTSGSIKIGADEEFKPLTRAEVNVYSALYLNTKITPVFGSEDSMVDLLMKDSIRLAVISRKLSKTEETYFNNLKLFPEQVKIAGDAITFIVNKDNPDAMLTAEQVKDIFKGKDSLWSQVGKANEQGKITAVFDYQNSGNAKYITNNFIQGQKFPAWCFALNGNKKVIDYVSRTPNSLGIIGLNWLSSEYDTAVLNALKHVKIVAVSAKESNNAGDYVTPSMETIASGEYPFCRDIYIVSREAYTGLGSGFLAHVTSNKGQRIIYQEGLLPVHMPSHNIHY